MSSSQRCPRGAAAATQRSLCGRAWSQAAVAVDPSVAAGAVAAKSWLFPGAAAAANDEAAATATASCLAPGAVAVAVAVAQRRQRACIGERQPRSVCHRLSLPSPSPQQQPPTPSPIAFDHGTGWPCCACMLRLRGKLGRGDAPPVAMVAQSQAGAPLYLCPPPLAVSTDIFEGGHGAHRCTEANSAAPHWPALVTAAGAVAVQDMFTPQKGKRKRRDTGVRNEDRRRLLCCASLPRSGGVRPAPGRPGACAWRQCCCLPFHR